MNAAPAGAGTRRRRSLLIVAAAFAMALVVVVAWITVARDGGDPRGEDRKGIPAVHPMPQDVRSGNGTVPLNGRVYIVAAPGTDPASISVIQDLVADAGGMSEPGAATGSPEEGSSEVHLGTDEAAGTLLKDVAGGNPETVQDALERPEGYAIATGEREGIPTAVLAASDGDGLFHAVQTLRQLVKDGAVASVRISDWPLMETRGVIEGFYGTPWSHQARLDVIAFAGRQKMNTYIYSPKDDPLLRDKWRELYTDEELAELQELIATATANHVGFSYALSPGIDICYSRPSDLEDALAKLESLYSLGVRSFVIPLDDIATRVQCAGDLEEFGAGQANLARAQARFLNRVNEQFSAAKEGLQPLETVPTFYNGSASNAYKEVLGESLDPSIVVQWTGEDVVSHRITAQSARDASRTYGTAGTPRALVVWDNYPVNDFSQDHLFMAPVVGRDATLHQTVRGMVTNPMIQPYLSLPAVFTYADFTWNGPAYDPKDSMDAALDLLAGPDPEVRSAVRAFADLNQEWQDDPLTPSAPQLRADIERFWSDYDAGRSPSGDLLARARLLQRLPELLQRMAVPGFASDASHWSTAAAEYGRGVEDALEMLEASARNDSAGVAEGRRNVERALTAAGARTQPTLELGVVTPILGDSELKTFLERALETLPPN
ncbi:beta-N-acetylhexosaminidase family protein [Paenarthrobacter sp. NyZ202]|uniref:beta-N-acetylhexosaminidase family protein n=1 Tax=Paenarthrobacter sp. NyZ202 TaxID=3402689 RepID=UPI003CF227C4